MSNSALVNYTRISPNRTSPRNQKIDRITIHHMAGNLSVESCGNVFAPSSRQASSNYGIDSEGRVGMYVEEKDRSWCSSSGANDHRAVTIEVADNAGAPGWGCSEKAMNKLIELCADICRRNGIARLNYTGDTNGNLTMHKWFAATDCPGAYLESKFPWIADQVNKILAGGTADSAGSGNANDSQDTTQSLDGYSVGDWVTVSSYYAASTDPVAKAIFPKSWVYQQITKILPGTHNPFLLGNGFAWCNTGDIRGKGDLRGNQSKPTASSGKIKEDGFWGTDTTRKAQAVFGTGSDGIVSNQLSCYKGICAGVVGSFQWENTKKGGSALIKAIQNKIGVSADGYVGPDFIRGMQKWLGCTQDGSFSNPSTCIRKFQEWLNQQ